MLCRPDRDVIVVEPEADLVPGLYPELITELLGDDHLSLGTHPVSHTSKYN